MANRLISDDEFLDRALELFRTRGVEGVSLSQLAQATGLEKASLYYRYPRGKDQIVFAVVESVIAWFQKHVFAPLQTEAAPRQRVEMVTEQLREFYGNGSKSCVTDVLSIAGGSEEVKQALKLAMCAWLQAFSQIARESGASEKAANEKAEAAIVSIEGSLVLARVLGDTTPFTHALDQLPVLLTG